MYHVADLGVGHGQEHRRAVVLAEDVPGAAGLQRRHEAALSQDLFGLFQPLPPPQVFHPGRW